MTQIHTKVKSHHDFCQTPDLGLGLGVEFTFAGDNNNNNNNYNNNNKNPHLNFFKLRDRVGSGVKGQRIRDKG